MRGAGIYTYAIFFGRILEAVSIEENRSDNFENRDAICSARVNDCHALAGIFRISG